jgi:outer membrane protein OmpA-like peptidoglycan-associated protein
VTYLAGRPISEDASALIAAEVGDRLALPRNSVRLQWAPSRNVLEFSRGERAIDESMRQQLRPAADLLRRYPDLRLSIQVRETNELALERTTAIAETFAAAGVALDRIRVEERPEQTRDDAVSLLIEREI